MTADLDNPEALKTAFAGTHAIFAVTDWAANFTRVSENEQLKEAAKDAGRSIEQYAGDMEQSQGINVAKAASKPDVLSSLERFVFSTLAPVSKISGGKYTHAYEFDSKAGTEEYIRQNLPELQSRLSTVTMGIYQENWKVIPAFRPRKLADGSFELLRMKTPGSHTANPEVIATRDAGAFVEALILHHPAGTHVLGASEIITKADYAALWGQTLGVEATTRDVSEEEYVRYIPEGMERTIADLFRFFAEYGYAGGNPNVKTPSELGIKTTSLKEYFQGEDWRAVLDGDM